MQEKYIVYQRKNGLTIKMGGLFKNLRCLQKVNLCLHDFVNA